MTRVSSIGIAALFSIKAYGVPSKPETKGGEPRINPFESSELLPSGPVTNIRITDPLGAAATPLNEPLN